MDVNTNVDVIDFKNTCRICLGNLNPNPVSLFSDKVPDISLAYSEIFISCTTIQVIQVDDGLPSFICQLCAKLVVQCFQFRDKCHNSDKILHEMKINIAQEVRCEIENDDGGVSNDSVSYASGEKPAIREEVLNKITCDICGKTYQSEKLVKDHVKRIHSGSKPFVCSVCGRAFNVRGNLNRHKLIHSKVKPHVCTECPSAFIQLVQLKDHIKRHHTFEKPFQCPHCDKRYVVSQDLKRHLEIHEHSLKDEVINDKYMCGICKLQFDSPEKLKSHKITHLSYSHLCSECGRSFSTKRGLNLHLETHGEKLIKCPHCSKDFSSKFKLELHLRTHAPKKFLCSHCGKGFTTKNSLVLHTSTHSDDRPFVCKEIGCGKRFRQKNSLKFHTLTHTGEKKYRCDVCGKAFAQTGHLYYHKRYHNGIKPYVCLVCDKNFSMKTSYESHMRRHRGERPFICDVCQLSFYDSSGLNRHKKRLHSQKKKTT